MKLYFNGCSHTFGDDLRDRNLAWPALVAKHLQCEFVNDAVSGGTNCRLQYRTIKHVQDFDFFCLAWTYNARFTRYRADNNHDVNFNPQLIHSLYGDCVEFSQYAKLHYAFWHNELYALKLQLQNIIMLQRYLSSMNKRYIMINAYHNNIKRWNVDRNLFNSSVKSLICFDLMSDEQLDAEYAEIQNLIKQIDTTNYLGFDSWCITDLHKQYKVGPTGHLLADGHQAVADYLLSHGSF